MPKVGEAFPSKWLKADDLQGRACVVTISRLASEDVGDDTEKPVLYFAGKAKGLVLNKTNANIIAEVLGTDEMNDWRGRAITLYPTRVEFQGKKVNAIRVQDVAPAAPQVPHRSPEPPPEFQAEDSDIPF